jgi:hypothetical protein
MKDYSFMYGEKKKAEEGRQEATWIFNVLWEPRKRLTKSILAQRGLE